MTSLVARALVPAASTLVSTHGEVCNYARLWVLPALYPEKIRSKAPSVDTNVDAAGTSARATTGIP
jgi:hypothetical protein